MPSKYRKKSKKKPTLQEFIPKSDLESAVFVDAVPGVHEGYTMKAETKPVYTHEAYDIIKKDKKYFKVMVDYNLETGEAKVREVVKVADSLDMASYRGQQYIVHKIVNYSKRTQS